MSEGHFGLRLPFDTNSVDFARGVEVGRLWEHLNANPEPFEQLVHTGTAEMLLRVAEALGRTVQTEEHDDVWMTVTFGEAGSSVREGGGERG